MPLTVDDRSLMCPFPQTADYVGNVSGARAANESRPNILPFGHGLDDYWVHVDAKLT